jgi:polyadenylation factor subunit 2
LLSSCSRFADVPADQTREGERTVQIAVPARCVSSACTLARTLLQRPYQNGATGAPALPPTAAGQLQLLLPSEYLATPAAAIASKLAHTCSNHFKMGLTVCSFHPQSSRVVTGNKSGELALWELTNGFRFVKQFAAHTHANKIYAMRWSHNELYCLTGDHKGYIKCALHACCSTACAMRLRCRSQALSATSHVFELELELHGIAGHVRDGARASRRYWKQTFEPYRLGLEGRLIHPDSAIYDVAWAPADTKFATASEDHSVRVWDVYSCAQHLQLDAHAGDCTSVDWHPTLSLLASGSRDTLVRSRLAPSWREGLSY